MSVGVYEIKKVVRKPLVALRRRRAGEQPPGALAILEPAGYSKGARLIMVMAAIDADHLYRADLDADSVVVDVGAFRGQGASQIHGLYACQVHGFEPNPYAYRALEERFADVDEVHTYSYGLGASDATLDLEVSGQGSSLHGLRDGRAPEQTVEVQIRDIVTVLDELGLDQVDLLKMNIEGAEYDLLDRLLAAGAMPRVRYLLVQFHEWHPGAHRRRRAIRRQLRRTHDLVWDYPWIFELWCDRSQPHPPPPELTPELREAIGAALRAKREEKEAAARSGDAGGSTSPDRRRRAQRKSRLAWSVAAGSGSGAR